ncbi:MAG TPA: uL30 family ribosomal protein [archaeon]|nr:uL30 family ribosomal protein [archaeon]
MTEKMLGVVRLKGNVGTERNLRSALASLGMKKTNMVAFMSDTSSNRGLLQRCNFIVTWGEVDEGFAKLHSTGKPISLSPPKGGFRSFHSAYPKGDLGYRGDKIKDLIERMLKMKPL